MRYLIEQFKWDEENGFRFYHLIDSKEFESDQFLEQSYCKNGSYFNIIEFNNEIQTKSRIRTRKPNKNE